MLRVGNLETLRDFSDVRDVCDACLLLLERATRDPHRSGARPGLEPAQVQLAGAAGPLCALGWRPAREIDATLAELLQDWRGRR